MAKLYEFSALLSCSAVIYAESEEDARAEVKTWEKAWIETGDFNCVSDVELCDVRHGYPDNAHCVSPPTSREPTEQSQTDSNGGW
jgi:hypothetical protein